MTFHAKYSLGRPSVFEIFDLLLAVPTFEAVGAEGLITGKDGQILDLVITDAAAISTVVANE